MNVASLELSEKLYELSGWDDCRLFYNDDPDVDDPVGYPAMGEVNEYEVYASVPAYDLGYLLRKLPPQIDSIYDLVLSPLQEGWMVAYCEPDGHTQYQNESGNPEDAAAKLAIELFEQGILRGNDE